MNQFAKLLIAGVFTMAAGAGSAEAQCEQSSGEVNGCGEANVRLTPVFNSVNQYWTTDQHDTGRSTAYAVLECHNAGVTRILFRGQLTVGRNYVCGTGSLVSYPLIRTAVCGMEPSCG